MTTKNNKYNRRNRHKSNKRITKSSTKTKKIKKTVEFNKYVNSDGSHSFNYIKMPHIDTTMIESKNILLPLKNIKHNKDELNVEASFSDTLNQIKKNEKINHLSPSKDFYTFVNYTWMKEQDIKLSYEKHYFIKLDSFRFLQDTVNHRIIQLATDYYKNNKNPTARKVENIIKSMDISNLAFNKLKKHIDIMENEYTHYTKNDDLIGYLSCINRCELICWGCPIYWSVYQDEKDAVNIRSHVQSPSLSFYDYDLYITGTENTKYTRKFREEFADTFCIFVRTLFDKLLGANHGLNPKHVVDCEIDIFKAIESVSVESDSLDFYNVVSINESESKLGFDWRKFAEGVGFNSADVPKSYITGSQSYIKNIMKKLKTDWKNEKWKAYWYYMKLRKICIFNKETHHLRYEFFKKYAKGQSAILPKKLFPMFALSYCFNTLLSRLYVDKYVKPGSIYIANTMGEEIRKRFIQIIEENKWLQPETKKEALLKLKTISIETVYPKYMIEDFDVDLPEGDAFGIMFAQSQAMREYLIKNEGKHFVDLPSIDFTVKGGLALNGTQPYIVNAFYNPTRNNIYVPAAILEEPFVSLNSKSFEFNLAHIGYTFGHEFSHSLDNTGRLFDHRGNMNNWWKKEDEKIFNSKVKDVIKQYELFASWDGIKMDASTMVGESMADISGLELCIEYLNSYLNAQGSIDKVKEQVFKAFFTYLAYQWREAIYKQAIRFNIKTNPHPLVKYRTNCPLARSMIFKNIYNVKKGDHMYWKNDTIWSNN